MNLGGQQLLRPPTEPYAIVVPGMRADRDAVPHRHRHRCPHGLRVTRMKAAGNIRRGHQPEERLVGFRVSLTDVGIHVELSHPTIVRRFVRFALVGR